jgi:hypothetical protein
MRCLRPLPLFLLSALSCGTRHDATPSPVGSSSSGAGPVDADGAGEGSSVGPNASSGSSSSGAAAGSGGSSGSSGSGSSGGSGGASDAGAAIPQAVWTNRYNSQRTGATTVETQLTQANVGQAGKFGLLFSRQVDGTVQAQPLYVPGITINGATHNVVFVATFHNSVYAFDADDPAQSAPLWTRNLGPSVPASAAIFQCADIIPEAGISSTPVIDTLTTTMYVVAKTLEAGVYHIRLHALDILTGAERQTNVDIKATAPGTAGDSDAGLITLNLMAHQQRPALLLENGVLYLAFGSHCDIKPYYHGWVQAYDAPTLALRGTFITTPAGNQGGIWQSGMGLSSDGTGVYFVAGNGDIDPTGMHAQFGESVGRLQLGAAGLAVADFWTPAAAIYFSTHDLDLTSGVVIGPGRYAFVGGKTGRFFVLDRTNMGGYQPTGDQIVQSVNYAFDVTGAKIYDGGGGIAADIAGHLHGSPVYWDGPTGGRIFVFPEEGTLQAFSFDAAAAANPVNPTAIGVNATVKPTHPGGIVTVSSNGTAPGSGIVWASLALHGTNAWHSLVAGVLYAFNAEDVSKVLWRSDQNAADALGLFAKFCPPTVVNGRLYIGTAINVSNNTAFLRVYGLH